MSLEYGTVCEDQGIAGDSAKGENYSVAVNKADQMTSTDMTKRVSPANSSMRVHSTINFQS